MDANILQNLDNAKYLNEINIIIGQITELRKFCPHALKGQKPLAQGIALGYYGRKPVALKGQKLYNTSQPNPGTRNSHHIPHYIISRTLYIPLQTNALCDALSDWQCIVMFYLQLIG